MANKIVIKALKWRNQIFPSGCMKEISCNFKQTGYVWRTPKYATDGLVVGYNEVSGSLTKPTADSFKVIKIVADGNNIEALVGDSDTELALSTACNICCGDTPTDFSKNTVPAATTEVTPCTATDGTRKICNVVPTLASGETLKVLGATFNGVAATPAASASYASAAALKTWLSANWGAYGTFTHDTTNGIICIALATGVTSANFNITK